MLIQPDTYIRLIKNCPLDDSYTHTIYFETEAEQTDYFKNTLQGINFTKQSYQRYAKGVLHIQEKAENLYSCNYLMFQNTAFGNKYFYAFITSIEYVNNVSSRVYYEIDVMQTWLKAHDFGECFVEREHSKTDNIGDNLVPENLQTGEFLLKKLDVDNCPFEPGKYDIYVISGVAPEPEESPGCVISNIFNGLKVTRFDTPSAAYEYLFNINKDGQSDGVVSVNMIPESFSKIETPRPTFSTLGGANAVVSGGGLKNPYNTDFDGFTPNNNKLYTSPYFGLICTSSSGDSKYYGYEYFENPENPRFGITYAISSTPECVLTPFNYMGTALNYNYDLVCNDFPQCAYATDTFRAYVAQNAGKLQASVVQMGLKVGEAIGRTAIEQNRPMFRPGAAENREANAQSTALSTGVSVLSDIVGTVGQLRDISILPPKVRGSGGSSMNYARNTVGFIFYQYRITREFAQIIDSFFDMFGYATHRVKYPEIKNRPYWNYIKTKGCVLHGPIPADDMRILHNIYDNGITFWSKDVDIGVYSHNNKPIETEG